jgi:hypothetical protein
VCRLPRFEFCDGVCARLRGNSVLSGNGEPGTVRTPRGLWRVSSRADRDQKQDEDRQVRSSHHALSAQDNGSTLSSPTHPS